MTQIATRTCGTCTLCCRLPEIDAFDKPANEPCVHCVIGHGCAAYEVRPALCRDFLCLWMTDGTLGPEWDPSTAHLMVYRQGPQVTVLADPEYPSSWRTEPHAAQLREWAVREDAAGGYVIVFVGDAVFKIEPERRVAGATIP